MFRALCAHHQEVKIALHCLWYRHTYRWPSRAQVESIQTIEETEKDNLADLDNDDSLPVHETATCRCDDTRGCVMQF